MVAGPRETGSTHTQALDRLRTLPAVERTGVSASTAHGSDLIVADRVEAYVRRSDLDELVARFALDPDGFERNVLLRVVEDEDWPSLPGDGAAGRTAVAVDLLESTDPRTRQAGHDCWANDDQLAGRRARSTAPSSAPGHDEQLWPALIELTAVQPGGWTRRMGGPPGHHLTRTAGVDRPGLGDAVCHPWPGRKGSHFTLLARARREMADFFALPAFARPPMR